ncbi:ribonuclease P protein component [Rugosibacter aromaticivorans]|uniref:ribonuclease P protein component n=1 Tax=Rugosibacter aromaticivorans TaxID=1565605 RepID=UPI0012243FED|nr:MAG: ribonuclease P protein component [Rugosibacter sp.]
MTSIPFCFGPEKRLHNPKEFSGVLLSRRVVRGESDSPFTLHFRLLEKPGSSRLGVVVPKKLVKQAVLRNAIKRQGREAFRLLANELPPCDVVLRVNRPLGNRGSSKHLFRKGWRSLIDDLLKRLVTP